MPTSINRVAALLILAFVLLIGALSFWAASGPALTAREDNPRRILAEQRILRGPILDRDGETLVETVGEPGTYTRHYLYPNAAPFTGYYSINYGTSEVEQAYDATLRGTLGLDPTQAQVDALLHIDPVGRGVQLTIDLGVQRVADALLDGHTGAIVVLSVPDSTIRAMSSRPTFDPNTLDEDWDRLRADPSAPLLNRTTQGQYQPGTALEPVVLAESLRRGIATLDTVPEKPMRTMAIDSQSLACREDSDVITLADALRAACPVPFADLGAALGSEGLWQMASTWGLTETSVIGLQSGEPITTPIALTDTQTLRQFAVGQSSLTVSPLQMAVVASTLAGRGNLTPPSIVSGTQALDGAWQSADRPPARRIAPGDVVDRVVSALPRTDNFVWHAGMGLSGQAKLLWLIGFTPIDEPQHAVAVLIEQGPGSAESDRAAIEIGQQLLAALSR